MKKFTYITLWLVGIIGTLSVWVASATTDLELYFLNNAGTVSHYTIMDRNMGASEVYNQDWDNQNTGSYWYIYQRWNNYGFTSTSSDFTGEFTGVQVPKSVRYEYSPSSYSNHIRYAGADSWMWWGGPYDNIWWWASDTSSANWAGTTLNRQWPCPDGYYIPSVHDWNLIKNNWSEYSNRGDRRTGFAYDLLLPPAGIRKNESWIAKAFNVGKVWDYRTSSPRRDSDTWAYVLYFGTGIDKYNPPITDPVPSRSMGASLRCFKSGFQNDWILKFHFNWWEKGMIAVSDGKFTSMPNPYKSISNFEGWYTTPDFQTWTKLWVWGDTDGVTDLYAKWSCFTWYVLSGNDCVQWTIVTFNTYCWVSQPSSITVPQWTVLDFSWEVVNLPNWMTVTITWNENACPWQTFVWWSTGNNNRAIKTLVIQDGEYNVTLHAIFRSNFTINFNATKNWWEIDTGYISVPYGTLVDLSEYTATKGSWWVRTFLWRNTNSGATSGFPNIYKAEDEDSDSVTLYAIFRKDKFNINFVTNGHGDTPSTQTINRWDKIINPWNLTAPWYNFEWWSENEYLTTNFDFWITPTDNVTLYAKWKAPWAECYEWFEYDNNLWMCIKKNEWVIRVWMNWTVLLSSKYSDVVDWYISMQYSWLDLSKVQGIDIAKSYLWVILSEQINRNFLDIDSGEWPNSNWQILEISAWSWEDKKLLFTMITNWRCRGEEPDLSCNFNSLDTIKADNISSWDNVSIPIPDITKQNTPPEFLERFEWADNIRIIFDPRAFITFDSNGHWNAPAPQFVNEWGKINKPQSPSAEWYNFVGWSNDEYLTSIFDFNSVVNEDTKLYAKWKSIWSNWYSCAEWQEYDNSVGLCKKPTDWVIRIWYNWDAEFSSWYSLFLDNALSGLNTELSESELEAFKKAFWILIASEIFDWTDEIMIDQNGIVEDENFWLLDYYNKNWKLLFTVGVDMSWTESHSSWWSIQLIIHTRSTYVNIANNVSSSDNLKLVPSSTGINEYVEAYPPIAQLENLWIIFSDRMEPNIINNWWNHYSWWWSRNKSDINDHFSADDQDNNTDTEQTTDEFQQAYKFAYENWITTMDTIDKADMEGLLTRIAMAKMLSNYAINVLGKKPANIIVPNFSDITTKLDEEYDFWVTLWYQLWIMWINMPNNEFRPFDYVTRAEFATALSRMLFWTHDGDPYYVTHIEKLKAEWIITNDDPDMQELRWYVMIMLMRSAI